MLAEAHIAQLIFLEVAFYPKALSDQSEHRPGRADEIADLQLINLGDNACLGSPHSGITQVETRPIQRCMCLLHLRLLFSGCIDMARDCRPRSADGRVGKECASECSTGWARLP